MALQDDTRRISTSPRTEREGLGLLVVPGPRWARVVTEVVTGVTVLSMLTATTYDGVAAAVMALVLLGLVVPRVAGVPAPLQAVSGVVLIGAAWASVLNGYERVWWLDIVVHLLANGVLAAVVTVVLLRGGVVLAPPGRRGRVGLVLLVVAVGLALAVLWELGEWFGHGYVDEMVRVGYDDTIGDLAAGGVGALLAGLAVSRAGSTAHRARRGR